MTLWLLQVRPKNDLQPSHVKAPKWKPAAGSSHTLHIWFCIGSSLSNCNRNEENLRLPVRKISSPIYFIPWYLALARNPNCCGVFCMFRSRVQGYAWLLSSHTYDNFYQDRVTAIVKQFPAKPSYYCYYIVPRSRRRCRYLNQYCTKVLQSGATLMSKSEYR